MIGNQIPEISVIPVSSFAPEKQKARDRVVAGLMSPGNVVNLRPGLSSDARHRRRWASRIPEPQPAVLTGALQPSVHGSPLILGRPASVKRSRIPAPRGALCQDRGAQGGAHTHENASRTDPRDGAPH